MVNAYNVHTDGSWTASPKCSALCFKHVDYAHDLLDHRLGNDLHFHTDLNVCDMASCDLETSIIYGFALRHTLAERSIASSCLDALCEIT